MSSPLNKAIITYKNQPLIFKISEAIKTKQVKSTVHALSFRQLKCLASYPPKIRNSY